MKPGPKPRPRTICAIPDCGKPSANHRGWCFNHYYRWKKYGDPAAGRPVDNGRRRDFLAKALASSTDACILWPFRQSEYGYAIWHKVRVSRIVCEEVYGPSELLALHSCDVKACINPRHLRWGTYSDNIQDAWDRGQRAR